MNEQGSRPPSGLPPDEEFGHPRGTIAIVFIFGALFALGWLAMYFFRFLGRGAPSA